MKDIFVSNIYNYLQKEIKATFLLKEITYSENKEKNTWQEIKFVDKTGELMSRAWAEIASPEYVALRGKVVTVLGMIHIYQDRPEIQIVAMDEAKEYDWSDYVVSLEQEKASKCHETIKEYIEMVEDVPIKTLLKKVFEPKVLEKMSLSIGGYLHHNYFGGLIVHLMETCTAAIHKVKALSDSFSPYTKEASLDLVIAGALLHEIGLLKAYTAYPFGEQTVRGQLIGSSEESMLCTYQYLRSIPKKDRIQDTTLLEHIILTAESNGDYGPKPKTIEAVIVNEANRESIDRDGFYMAFVSEDRKGFVKSKTYSKLHGTQIIREVQ